MSYKKIKGRKPKGKRKSTTVKLADRPTEFPSFDEKITPIKWERFSIFKEAMQEKSKRYLKYIFPLILISVLISCGPPHEQISYNQDIRPIFNKNCLACHGGVRKSGGFSLLFPEEALDTTESGKAAIIPGKAGKSELLKRLRHHDPELRMPYERDPLSESEILLIEQWIDQGAKFETHWAYLPPQKNIPVPQIPDSIAHKELDKFIVDQFPNKSLSLSEKADKPTLLRRLALDLTGLPPAIAHYQKFEADTSKAAFEKMVDLYLSSPHFGEKWATMWLDLARYADSKGYEKDLNRSIWKYRDWVIRAFNADLPFDVFTIQQLAGDMLVEPTEDQLIATAFHRNAMANDEGGTNDEEFRIAAVIDRVNTTWESWMGTTMACVQCHSHPYDQFRQKDYYESFAILNNTADTDLYNEQPKLFTFEDSTKIIVEETLSWLKEHSSVPIELPQQLFLSEKRKSALQQLDYLKIEAEEYQEHSYLIELTQPDQLSVFQIQDSSWIMYKDVELTDIQSISLNISSRIAGGWIHFYADSLYGVKLASIKVPVTGDWKTWVEIHTDIKEIEGIHDLYFSFNMGEIPQSDLFRIDWFYLHKKQSAFSKENTIVREKIEALYQHPAVATPIMQELKDNQQRRTYLFERGNWLSPGEEVYPGIPAILRANEQPITDRLSFAQWITDPGHPLTSRVMVNRIWEQLFGKGLVKTLEDFGSQGDMPTHPQLLDYLARKWTDQLQWSVKGLIREIVLSDTYQQSSIIDSLSSAWDPSNDFYTRYSRNRLSAEQIRDQALAVSGKLDSTMHGPPILLNRPDKRVRDPYKQAQFIDYQPNRRALYNFWKRTIPNTLLTSFDSPSRNVCVSRRVATNTPLQALVLLNDSIFYSAAEGLGSFMASSSPDNPEEGIEAGYYALMGKKLSQAKMQALMELYDSLIHPAQGNSPTQQAKSIKVKVLNIPTTKHRQAMIIIANAILNFDEVITKS